MLSAFFHSEVSRRFDEVTVLYASGNVTGGHSFIPSTKSFFGISYRQLSMPKDLTLPKKQMSINVFHVISAIKSTITVHVNSLSYTQDDVVNI